MYGQHAWGLFGGATGMGGSLYRGMGNLGNEEGLGGDDLGYPNYQHTQNNRSFAKGVYLPGSEFHSNSPNKKITKVAPATHGIPPGQFQTYENGIVYDALKPMILLIRFMGIRPIGLIKKGVFGLSPILFACSAGLFTFFAAYVGYLKWNKIQIIKSAEGRFEEAVIDYLFTVYLFPLLLMPISWYETKKTSAVLTDWYKFETIYKNVAGRNLPLFMGNKPLLITFILPLISCIIMVATHITMAHFKIMQVIPYCYINTLTYAIGGMWYLQCDVIGRVATALARDFQKALKHVGPSSMVAEYRALWMFLAKITRDIGLASCYALMFLCLYLFLVITLTIYGLLSQVQEGLGIKDVGLSITAGLAVALLYFICDEAHYASNRVKVNFQKKLLLVELSWMNDDAQQEVTMFLRATEMNETDMSLGGFFSVNRGLFKSLLATMVTYLVVLLQFQISLPEETGEFFFSTIASLFGSTVKPTASS